MDVLVFDPATGKVLRAITSSMVDDENLAVVSLFEGDYDPALLSAPCSIVGDQLVVDPDFAEAEAWRLLREERDRLLVGTDKYVLPDYPIDEDTLAAVLGYRDALRHLPEDTVDPFHPAWPVSPV